MTFEQFLAELQFIMQSDTPLTADTHLWDIEEWDSLAIMSCMAWFDKNFGVKTKFAQYSALDTPAQVAALVGAAIKD